MHYNWLRKLHLWLSLAAALPLVILSLTGALLVYGHELQEMLQPELWTVERPTPDAEPLPYSTLIERIAEQKPDVRVWSFGIGEDGARGEGGSDKAWTLWLGGGAGILNLDPYTGRILDHYKGDETPYDFVRAIHRRWLTSDGTVTPIARNIISAVSVLLIVQMIVGLFMWLLPAKRLSRLKVDFKRSTRIVVLRLHQLTGVVTALILVTVAFTGMALYWHGPMEAVVEFTTGQEVTTPSEPQLPPNRMEVHDIDAAVAAGQAAFPEAKLLHFRAPQPGKPLSMGFQQPGHLVPSQVWVGGDPPRVLGTDDAADLNAVTWFWRAKYWIHMGDFAGPIVRALWVIVALLPTAYVVSGLWLWLDRRGRRRARQSRAAPARA
ncbi:PepSY domain-containing protein [Marivibrio halodurans]|uniref:PepSY domain-containing protein n=1 Tax=Marivibrio halodurans TaxID=2039722 RepID=A0A8J7RW66_9PROT|nr:PepSY-associated TM helix domain-containing protein [Marivibrio halodurans]MBP5855812.1 PepSY domain-containing protein [Marivibrio halodurans]